RVNHDYAVQKQIPERERSPQARPGIRRGFVAQAPLLLAEELLAKLQTAIRVYSRNRALFLPCATPQGPCIQSFQSKQFAQLSSSAQYRTSALPHFLSHSLSCTFVQVAKSSGGVLYFTHGMILP